VSWATASGVYLIGGWDNLRSSEKVKLDGSVEEGFSLKYDTNLACAIPDHDNKAVIITGGWRTLKTVSVYSELGWQRDLTSLNQGRRYHGCGSYVNGGKKFIMVTGGSTGTSVLDSTEIFSDTVWKTVTAKLPLAVDGLQVATINNRVLSFGGYDGDTPSGGNFRKEVFEFNPETETWSVIGKMKESRRFHAVSVISFENYEKWCN